MTAILSFNFLLCHLFYPLPPRPLLHELSPPCLSCCVHSYFSSVLPLWSRTSSRLSHSKTSVLSLPPLHYLSKTLYLSFLFLIHFSESREQSGASGGPLGPWAIFCYSDKSRPLHQRIQQLLQRVFGHIQLLKETHHFSSDEAVFPISCYQMCPAASFTYIQNLNKYVDLSNQLKNHL